LSLLVVLDVDSTLIQQEVIELLAERAGFASEVEKITEQAMSGEIDFADSLQKRVAVLEGLDESVFDSVLSEIEITDGVTELIAAVHNAGGKVGVVSGGFSQILDPLAASIGLDYWKANQLEVIGGKLTGKLVGDIVDAKAKADSMLEWAEKSGVAKAGCVAVGDGANDILMLEAAGLAVGFRPKKILRDYADFVIEQNTLLPLIEKLGLSAS